MTKFTDNTPVVQTSTDVSDAETKLTSNSSANMNTLNANTELSIATFNLLNYLEPPSACYDFDRIYSIEQWQKKQTWISEYLQQYQPDIIGFQEIFSPESLQTLVANNGYQYFEVVDQAEVVDDFIYRSPVVGIASRYPIVNITAVKTDTELAQKLGLTNSFNFSRKVLRATINLPHLGHCDCYVVHFKSKRSMLEADEPTADCSAEESIIESLKTEIAGSWASSIQRGSEATLLMLEIIERRKATGNPMILMGDFNNSLHDGILNHLLTNNLRFVTTIDKTAYLAKYCLQDAWDLFETVLKNENEPNKPHIEYTTDDNQLTKPRSPTHYYGASNSILDYILLSNEFDASYHGSLYQVSEHHTYDRHLINPIFDRDGESTDHAIVTIKLSLRS